MDIIMNKQLNPPPKAPLPFLVLCAVLAWPAASLADVISGEITFIKRAPFSGVLFVKQDQAAQVTATMDQLDKAFTKKAVVGSPGSTIIFKNGDSFDHNIFANDLGKKISFDVGLMPSGQSTELSRDWQQNTMVRIGCKIHPKMRAYIANVNSDHYQVFEFQKKVKKYTVNIEDVPGDSHQLACMIPKYDTIELTLAPGESKMVDIIKKGKVKGTLTLSRS